MSVNALPNAVSMWGSPDSIDKMLLNWAKDKDKLHMERNVASMVGEAGMVADVGCGSGRYADALVYNHYYGFDSSPLMIDRARVAHLGNPRVVFSCVDVFKHHSLVQYDAALMIDVAQHMDDPFEAVKTFMSMWPAPIQIFTILAGKAEDLYNSTVVDIVECLDFLNTIPVYKTVSIPVKGFEATSILVAVRNDYE